MTDWLPRPSEWRREALRTTLWLIPTIQVLAAAGLFVVTYSIDRMAYDGEITLPGWVNQGSADAARQILTAIAAAVITVVGLVFSITIVALVLASTQFGPRMLRNFVRDRGTQITLGTFVATFVYAILALGAVSQDGRREFVPHLSITAALGLVLMSLGVLIFFIHHIATSIQLPQVIAGIADDLSVAIERDIVSGANPEDVRTESGLSVHEVFQRMDERGAVIMAPHSGYLQFVAYDHLVDIAAGAGAVVLLLHKPGHFVVEGLPLARVWPADAAAEVSRRLKQSHYTGPHRTLTQDPAFAIDQLVEIALRALSPAVNDTFTALTCIDWLGDGLCKISASWDPFRFHRDRYGNLRVIAAEIRYERYVGRAFDKVRQTSGGMPAVMIRQLEALARVARYTKDGEQRASVFEQAELVLESSETTVLAKADREDVRRSYDSVVAVLTG